MKKLFAITLATLLITINGFSQTLHNGQLATPRPFNNLHKAKLPANAKPPFYNCNGQAKTTAFNLWIEPVGSVMLQNGIDETASSSVNSEGIFLNPIYQDSTVTVSDPNYTNSISTMMVGSVLDVTSSFLQPSLLPICTSGDAYSVDSIMISGAYVKATNAVDTLYTWLVWGDTSNSSIGFTKTSAANLWVAPIATFRTDAIGPKVIGATSAQGNRISSSVPGSNSMLVKYVLQITDTVGLANAVKLITIPLPSVVNVPAGNIISCYYTFVPGGTHSTGDCSFAYPGSLTPQTVNGFGGSIWSQTFPQVNSMFDYQPLQIDPTGWNMGESYSKEVRYAFPGYAARDSFVWGNLTIAPLIYYHIFGNSSVTAQAPVADFTIVPDANNPYNFWMFNSSTGGNLSNYWTFGDTSASSTSTLSSPMHTYATANTYNVCLSVSNGAGGNTVCHNVTVSGTSNTCMALYNISHDTTGTNPNAYTITDLSYGSNLTYLWDFGDTTTSTLQHPVHNYLGAGPYQLCLTVDNGAGCTQTYCDSLFAVDSLHSHLQPIAFTVVAGPPPPLATAISNVTANEGILISPNPFTSQTTISFIQEQKHTTIKITDVLGKEIKTLVLSGAKNVVIEKGEMERGIYFVRIEDDGSIGLPAKVENRKIVVE